VQVLEKYRLLFLRWSDYLGPEKERFPLKDCETSMAITRDPIDRRLFIASLIGLAVVPITACAEPAPLRVFKSPTCGCCSKWVKYLRKNGFIISTKDVSDEQLKKIKDILGIPLKYRSCHTGIMDKYWVEGHVPASDLKKLISSRPYAQGLAVPNMPIGSPGMEMGSRKDPFDTLLVIKNNKDMVFTQHNR
jgi:hypothetical protein